MMTSVALAAVGVLFYAMARPYGSTPWERVLAAALCGGGLYGLLGTAAAGLPASAIAPAFVLAALVVGAVVYALERLERVLTERAAGRRVAAAGARGPVAAPAGAGTWWPGRRRMAYSE